MLVAPQRRGRCPRLGAGEATTREVCEEGFPGLLAFLADEAIVDQFAGARGREPIGHEREAAFVALRRLGAETDGIEEQVLIAIPGGRVWNAATARSSVWVTLETVVGLTQRALALCSCICMRSGWMLRSTRSYSQSATCSDLLDHQGGTCEGRTSRRRGHEVRLREAVLQMIRSDA